MCCTRRNPVLEAPTCYGGALALNLKQLHSTERDIQRALDAASVGLTMVVVAHRWPDKTISSVKTVIQLPIRGVEYAKADLSCSQAEHRSWLQSDTCA